MRAKNGCWYFGAIYCNTRGHSMLNGWTFGELVMTRPSPDSLGHRQMGLQRTRADQVRPRNPARDPLSIERTR